MRARSPLVFLYLCCSVISIVYAYPDRSTLQIVRHLLDRVKDIDEVHIVEAKLLSDPKIDGFNQGPSAQHNLHPNHANKHEAAASSPRRVVAGNDPRQQIMFVDVGSILGIPQLGILRVPMGPSQGRHWIPANHLPAESQRLNFVASPNQNASLGNQTKPEPLQAPRNQRIFSPHPPQQHQQNQKQQQPQPPFRQAQHQPLTHFPVLILEATVARGSHSPTLPHAQPGGTGMHLGIPHRLIRSNSKPSIVINDFNPKLPLALAPQMRPPQAHPPRASERHSPPTWAPATAFADSAEFSHMPTLTANPVHRSPMASVRRLFGRPEEENIVITLPQPSNPQRARENPQSGSQQSSTTTEPPNARDVIRSKLFPHSTRKPSRRLIFKYLG